MTETGKRAPEDTESVCRSPPGFEQRIYAPHSIAAIVAELDKQGIPASVALKDAHLTLPQLQNHTTRISYRQLNIVIHNALRLSDDPALALHAGQLSERTSDRQSGASATSS
jgi:hypothetical protein